MLVVPLTPYVDAQLLAKQHPDTFFVPSQEVLNIIKPEKLVKVGTGDERFWVIVQSVEQNHLTGMIDNDLHNTHIHGLKADDLIRFEMRHIQAVWLDGDETFTAT